ncbi:MAG: hypothetical protein HY060_03235 [Proteobacteria bacterium]|nr:hypothetical protein [Pseudomonadota bacterium]
MAIINDVLDLSKAESDRLVLAEETVEIAPVVALSTSIVADMARKAGIEYSVAVEDALPAVRGDAPKLRQILINLLSNAFKFTPSGGKVSLTVARERGGGLAFRIADTGIGITRSRCRSSSRRSAKPTAGSPASTAASASGCR